MSDIEERNDKRASEEEDLPTASLSSSVEEPSGQIDAFRIERELGRGAKESR